MLKIIQACHLQEDLHLV
ncbi:toluene-tolerance protein (Ttg2E) [Acinetobacter baumannii TYTH-1]|nr:toluene-tolerance protein (Ttg2E) [Acinetobacter baumannii TYTH-1]